MNNRTDAYPHSLIIPLFKNELLGKSLEKIANVIGIDSELLQSEFKAEFKEVQSIYAVNRRKPDLKKVYLLGLGTTSNTGDLLDAFRSLGKRTNGKMSNTVGLELFLSNAPRRSEMVKNLVEAATNGLLLSQYNIGIYKTNDSESNNQPTDKKDYTIHVFAESRFDNIVHSAIHKGEVLAKAQLSVFDLVNGASNSITPQKLGEWAEVSGKEHQYKVTVFQKEQIEELGLHALLGVNRGSEYPPTFLVMEYLPQNHQEGNSPLPKIGIIGKGVTYDTGGLSIKTVNMQYMKSDMAGAAAVLGTMQAAATLQLPIHLIGVIPATDNCVDAKAIKPGDVISSYAGKSIEVDNTDAEGRLILADALAYIHRNFKPDVMIDLATLTGSCVATFGYKVAGLFSNNQDLAKRLYDAGQQTGEYLWQLPIWDVYKKAIASDIADLKNNNQPPVAGAIAAAKFLEVFIENHKAWAHLDIAGTAFGDSEYSGQKSATAYGVRLLIAYLEQSIK